MIGRSCGEKNWHRKSGIDADENWIRFFLGSSSFVFFFVWFVCFVVGFSFVFVRVI